MQTRIYYEFAIKIIKEGVSPINSSSEVARYIII